MSKTRRNKNRMSPLHGHEFSCMARSTRTKNKRKYASKLACRGNKAGKFKKGWGGYF